MTFDIIVAVDITGGIAINKHMPQWLPDYKKQDLKWFAKKTHNSIVIMGTNTFTDIGGALAGRYNIILSSQYTNTIIESIKTRTPVIRTHSLDRALEWCRLNVPFKKIYIIGGAALYLEAIQHSELQDVYVTHMPEYHKCDCFFPLRYLENATCTQIAVFNEMIIKKYTVLISEEQNYLQLLRELVTSPLRNNRTNVQTRSAFAKQLRFMLTGIRGKILPLLTTRRIHYISVIGELLWFLKGSIDINMLHNDNIHIWDANSQRDYLDSRKLYNYKVGTLGPIYGHQWRHWNQPWNTNKNSSSNPLSNTDQIAWVINEIKTNPTSRRLLVSAWNIEQLNEMALPPCHYAFQFYVSGDNMQYLSCVVSMRSTDVVLGLPFNIASYALLTHIIAAITNKTALELVINMTDCHVYENHIAGIFEQLLRVPHKFPTVMFSDRFIKSDTHNISDFINGLIITDFNIINYKPHPSIKFKMIA